MSRVKGNEDRKFRMERHTVSIEKARALVARGNDEIAECVQDMVAAAASSCELQALLMRSKLKKLPR